MNNTIKTDNNSNKILLIGANGFLGSNLLSLSKKDEYRPQKFFFIAADRNNSNISKSIPFHQMDIIKARDTFKKIIKISPNIIILTAAMTNVDECEKNKKVTFKINFVGVKNVIKACEKIKCKLLFMSSDFVFDGTKISGYYTENDTPNPINYYGKTKYLAEQAIVDSDLDYIICRTAVLYGWNQERINFITWILKNLEVKNKISIITTQINNPTFVINLAEILLKLLEKDTNGIYHTAGEMPLNRYEMAVKCAEIFNYDKDLISPLKTITQYALRPDNAGLDISKLKKLISNELKIFNLTDGLTYMKNHRETTF
jgi:dTDP-4-dehydrorhamnose reductase